MQYIYSSSSRLVNSRLKFPICSCSSSFPSGSTCKMDIASRRWSNDSSNISYIKYITTLLILDCIGLKIYRILWKWEWNQLKQDWMLPWLENPSIFLLQVLFVPKQQLLIAFQITVGLSILSFLAQLFLPIQEVVYLLKRKKNYLFICFHFEGYV